MQESEIENKFIINDLRSPSDFKSYTFSKYKKTDVRDKLIENIIKGKIEPACYWCAELICAGHFMEVWESALYILSKHIHLANPKLASYLENRFTIFRNIMTQGYYVTELDLRNSIKIRHLFAEIVCVLATSPKKHAFETIKINRQEEFDITQMTERLHAPSITFIENVFKREDPKEIYIALNEFAYNLQSKEMIVACYWIEWLIEFELICKNRKEPCVCKKRHDVPVDKKFQCDIIWIIWEIFQEYTEKLNNPFLIKIMNSLFQLFCIKYTGGAPKKRRYLLYYAVAILCEPVMTDIEMIPNKQQIEMVISKINEVYREIKKKEESPNTDYMFSNIDSQDNFNNSVKKLKIMQQIGES
jgi:hypothetical protein